MTVTDRIKQLAEINGHTIASIERELSFGQGSIRHWDKAAPAADKLYKVAKMFNVTMEYILTGKTNDIYETNKLSEDALKIAAIWDTLNESGKAITKGEIYRRAEEIAKPTSKEGEEAKSSRSGKKPA